MTCGYGEILLLIQQDAPRRFSDVGTVVMASNLLRLSKNKKSLRQKRHQAAWNEDYAFELITT